MGESGTASNSSSPSGYALGPPWLFRGRALYQLHLVKADIARALIPKELKLVEAFGYHLICVTYVTRYTLGGLFLAHYEDSPAGEFNELVVIPGIVWNPPTSCAWASRVLVNSHEACRHGRKEIGLPSQVAIFSKRDTAASEQPLYKCRTSSIHSKPKEQSEIQVLEMEDSSQIFICNISLPFAGDNRMGPQIRISLPSFSGQTIYNPRLLKYSCQIDCRVRAVEAAKISRPRTTQLNEFPNATEVKKINFDDRLTTENEERERSIAVLLSKPILALEFSLLKMQVEAPTDVTTQSRSKKNQVVDLRTC
ncbi:protein NEOXANTHIN-DEFICIENT 1 isoform X2 [Musa acuminata AAA Group]|uniref:protein NEOXANTHIN-DEFICIENT 1 isoform X2 n=1 Tax=Musa acuminata AAA Group TaxID=214697 RepID=UPI0031CE1C77